MTPREIELLKIYVLFSSLLVFVLALGVVWLTGWLDLRDERHKSDSPFRTR